jgi:hypothetical protein
MSHMVDSRNVVSIRGVRWGPRVIFCLASLAACAPAVLAQDTAPAQAPGETRASLLAAREAEKATRLAPYIPSKAERILLDVKNDLITPNGFYPFLESVYSGGGFTLGAGYRRFYADRTHWDIKGLYSIKSYKFLELSTDSWGHEGGRFDLHARVGWRDATQVAYHGLGIDSSSDRTNYRMKQAYGGGDVWFRPARPFVLGGGLAIEDFSLEQGKGTVPSIEEVFTPETAPGLGVSPTYLHSFASAGIDSRPAQDYARTGGLYQLMYENYADSDSTYSFDRLNIELVQHVPLMRENWVLSFHGLMQTTLGDDDLVPYFLLPSLGSGGTLRGYGSWRFRDRHSVLGTGEFRWIPSRLALDFALFYDAGMVAPKVDAFQMSRLKSDVGIGARFHGPFSTPLRIEVAKGSEGFHLVFAGSAAF